ncbi:hypothetical protein FKW77_005563 [Venturia effusa]|uniref:Uncharacterized protein n=1 Tax=Venturia effusa TaxID=50376 RepID=A0A517LHA3_9PEZI|nr:hypothetical protein FKW77_005563 [Venturia effusa]
MAIFNRRKSEKKPGVQEKKSPVVSPIEKQTPHPKYVHVPQHAAADSLNVKVPTARPDMRELVRREMTAPGTSKLVAPKLKSTNSWSAGDLTIATILEQGPARHSSRHSSFNAAHRRPTYRSSTSLGRSPLSNIIVEEELSETTGDTPAESTSSSDDGLEMKHGKSKLHVPAKEASAAKPTPELVSEPLAETSKALQLNPPITDKVDSFVDLPSEGSPVATVSPSADAYVRKSSPNLEERPTTPDRSLHLDLAIPPKSPTIDVFIESPKDDWFAENSRISRAFLENSAAEEAQEELHAPSIPKDSIEIPVESKAATDQSPMLESCATSLATGSQSEAPVNDSSVLESCASSMDLLQTPPASRGRLRQSESVDDGRSSSLGRAEHNEYIARQANAYNTVLGHLYPAGRSVTSPPDSMRHLHQSQRVSNQSPSRDGCRESLSVLQESTAQPPRLAHQAQLHEGSRRSPSVSSGSPSQSRRLSQQTQRYEGRRQSNSISSESSHSLWVPYHTQQADASFARVDMLMNQAGTQRFNTMIFHGHVSQTPEPSFVDYSGGIAFTRHGSFDSSSRVSDSRCMTATDDRLAAAQIESTYRQSAIDLFLNENTDSSSHCSRNDSESTVSMNDSGYASNSKYHTYSTSDSNNQHDSQCAYSVSSASNSISGKSHAYTNSDVSSLFPPPQVPNDPHRKLAQVLGNDFRPEAPQSAPAPLKERPLLMTEFLRSEEPPMVTRLEYPPSPPPAPKDMNLPGAEPKKKKSFMGRMRTK